MKQSRRGRFSCVVSRRRGRWKIEAERVAKGRKAIHRAGTQRREEKKGVRQRLIVVSE